MTSVDITQRLMKSSVVDPSGCWLYGGYIERNGYAKVGHNGRRQWAHRVSYEVHNGPIPDGMHIDHICRVRHCINPSHLRAVTRKQNMENVEARSTSRTGVRGVSLQWHHGRARFHVRVTHQGRTYRGGYFADIEEARKAAVALRNELFTHNAGDRRAEVAA